MADTKKNAQRKQVENLSVEKLEDRFAPSVSKLGSPGRDGMTRLGTE